MHSERYISISFQIEWNMIAMTVFFSILNVKWNSIRFKFEWKKVNTIICHVEIFKLEHEFLPDWKCNNDCKRTTVRETKKVNETLGAESVDL